MVTVAAQWLGLLGHVKGRALRKCAPWGADQGLV